MKTNILNKIYLILITFFLLVSISYATNGLNVILANQNPDPVRPGNFVEINVQVANTGGDTLENVQISFIENQNFKIAQGREKSINIGVLSPYSSLQGSRSFVIAKFIVEVNENTPFGQNPIEIKVTSPTIEYSKEIFINVLDKSPLLNIKNVISNEVQAGEINKISFEIENINGFPLKNTLIKLGLSDVENNILTSHSDTSQRVISNILAGENKKIEFDLLVSPSANSKAYLLPVSINFEDILGNSHSLNFYLSVLVNSEPKLSFKIDSQESFSLGKNKISFAISNPGTSSIKGTEIEILPSESYEVLSSYYTYIGDLNPDDFQTNQIEIYMKEKSNIRVKITYLDSLNKLEEKIVEVPIKIFSEEEMRTYGLLKEAGLNNGVIYFILFILIILAYILGRKKGSKKK